MPDKSRFRWRKTSVAAVLALLMLGASLKFRWKRYDSKAWMEDYNFVHDRIGRFYANLDFAAERGTPDLHKLDFHTVHAIEYASSDEEAQMELRHFVRAFGDGHLSLRKANAPPLDPEPAPDLLLSRFTSPERACEALGFNPSGEQDFPFQLEKVTQFRTRGGANSFAAGVLDFNGQRFGVIRIGSFDEKDFRGACRREWFAFRQSLAGTCEATCRFGFTLRVADRLLREIAARIRQLDQAGSQVLIVDVTGNRGGRGWYRLAAQLFAANYLPPLRAAYVRNSRTFESLVGDRWRLQRYLLRRNPAPAVRAQLEEALCRLDDLAAEAEKPCDAAGFWVNRTRQSGCTRLTTRPFYSSGYLDRYDGPQLPSEVQSRIFHDGIYGPTRFAWRGPVAVLIDEHSASAAELFAGNLQHLAGAMLIGRPTAATGDGWTLGRVAWILPRSKMQLYMPDTVEYWPDGENAREGLVPDVPTRWSRDDSPVKMGKDLLDALRSVDFAEARSVTPSE
jgi:C-terminal processing protease CtpA/Prc